MRHPNLLVSELGSIRALSILAIIILDNLATLHHEARNDSLENSIPVVDIQTVLARAERSEVFNSPGQLVLEKFHDYTLLLIALLSLSSDLYVHVDLNVVHRKVGNPAVDLRFIFSVLTIHENLHGISLDALISRLGTRLNEVSHLFP